MSFIVLALVVGGVACGHLAERSETTDHAMLLALAIPSVLLFSVLGLVKMWLGYATHSPSLKKDAA